MTITVNSIPTALQALILICFFVALSGLIDILRKRSTSVIDTPRDERHRWSYRNREPIAVFVYHGQAVGWATVGSALAVIGWCALGLAPRTFPLHMDPVQALAFALVTAFAGFLLVVFVWVFTNKAG
jgi:hypothetical protein